MGRAFCFILVNFPDIEKTTQICRFQRVKLGFFFSWRREGGIWKGGHFFAVMLAKIQEKRHIFFVVF